MDQHRKQPNTRTWLEVEHLSSYTPDVPAITQIMLAEAAAGDMRSRTAPRTIFDGADCMSFQDLMIRMVKYLHCSVPVFFVAAMHIGCSKLKVRSSNLCRTYITACMVSAKYLEDWHHSTEVYARVAGIPVEDMAMLERHFLDAVDWKLSFSAEEYEMFRETLTKWSEGVSPTRAPSPPTKPMPSARCSARLGTVHTPSPPPHCPSPPPRTPARH
eukprot:TRINITY_DN13643_c0_g1_i1.p1 TRINITY_DN13643_c0_g1~~TRINITY_DN13643_c0_g1_i1.p1  ORF type:complete len:215 (+),score=39.38 TRINITY_DN13643_c0_g1_i1:89-733(+)